MAKTPLALAIERRLYSTGQVARELGVTRAAIQMAELRGQIPPAAREPGGDDRLYTSADLERLKALIVDGRLGRRR